MRDSALVTDLSDGPNFDWYVFTSHNAVSGFFEHLKAAEKDSRSLAGASIACVGTETANALLSHGLRADITPTRQTSVGLLEKLDEVDSDFSEAPVCFPCSHIAAETIPSGLKERGARVSRYPVYRTVKPDYDAGEIESVFDPMPDLVTFTSSSTVNNLVSALKEAGREDLVDRLVGAAIGPSTAAAAAEHNIRVGCESEEPNIKELIKSIFEYLQEKE